MAASAIANACQSGGESNARFQSDTDEITVSENTTRITRIGRNARTRNTRNARTSEGKGFSLINWDTLNGPQPQMHVDKGFSGLQNVPPLATGRGQNTRENSMKYRFSRYAFSLSGAGARILVDTSANHNWRKYHWAKSTAVLSLQVGDNVGSQWDQYLDEAIFDWNTSARSRSQARSPAVLILLCASRPRDVSRPAMPRMATTAGSASRRSGSRAGITSARR